MCLHGLKMLDGFALGGRVGGGGLILLIRSPHYCFLVMIRRDIPEAPQGRSRPKLLPPERGGFPRRWLYAPGHESQNRYCFYQYFFVFRSIFWSKMLPPIDPKPKKITSEIDLDLNLFFQRFVDRFFANFVPAEPQKNIQKHYVFNWFFTFSTFFFY